MMAGFEPGTSLPEADAMSTVSRRRGEIFRQTCIIVDIDGVTVGRYKCTYTYVGMQIHLRQSNSTF
jgi:hypothetical protein